VKLHVPTDFHGAQELTTKFLQEVEMYMRANMEIYNTEEKKVLFALSFMNGGVAGSWKQGKTAAYLKARNFETFDEFKQAVQIAFTPIDDEGVAKTELRTLCQGDMRIKEYIAQFTIISETTTRKATIEEVLDEEAPTLVADRQPISDTILEEIPPLVIDSENSDEEPLNAATLESEDEMIIAYIKGEPVISIFEKKDTLFTRDHDYLKYDYGKNSSGIRWISTSIRLTRYTFGQDAWIRAKTSISQQLAHNKADSNLEKKKSLDNLFPKAYHEYKSVFEKEASERFPESRPWDHAIDLKPNFIPKDCKVYPLTLAEQMKLNEFLEENLRKGYIRPSKSLMVSPFFFVLKKDSDALHPCQDYRYLNDRTVKNMYPLPLVSDLLDKLKGANIFMKLDIRWGYHNIRIKEGNEWKGAFKTNKGLFEPTVMFFGLCNSLVTFQAMMNNIFRDMLNEGWLIIYMDDILIYSNDPEEHRK
jgi:hypothetical protein